MGKKKSNKSELIINENNNSQCNKSDKEFDKKELFKKIKERLRTQERVSGDKVWLPLRIFPKLYKGKGRNNDYNNWINCLAENIYIHYSEDNGKSITNVQLKDVNILNLKYDKDSEKYVVKIKINKGEKEYTCYSPTGVGNYKDIMKVNCISDLVIDHVKPIDLILRELDEENMIPNLRLISNVYKQLKEDNSKTELTDQALEELREAVDLIKLKTELEEIAKGRLRLVSSEVNAKKSNTMTYQKILKDSNNYYGILLDATCDKCDHQYKVYQILNNNSDKFYIGNPGEEHVKDINEVDINLL